jgi:hypothetical protein
MCVLVHVLVLRMLQSESSYLLLLFLYFGVLAAMRQHVPVLHFSILLFLAVTRKHMPTIFAAYLFHRRLFLCCNASEQQLAYTTTTWAADALACWWLMAIAHAELY